MQWLESPQADGVYSFPLKGRPVTDIEITAPNVTADRTFCVYLATDEALIYRHAELSGFPATKITEITKIIDPSTAARQ